MSDFGQRQTVDLCQPLKLISISGIRYIGIPAGLKKSNCLPSGDSSIISIFVSDEKQQPISKNNYVYSISVYDYHKIIKIK